MNKKLVLVAILFVFALMLIFAYQWHVAHPPLPDINKEHINPEPVVPPTKPANPEGVSPFDKPNVDATADQFKPTPKSDAPKTTIKFDNLLFDFGKTDQGKLVKTLFHFTNTGTIDMLITQAQPSCGCTITKFPQEPVKPGKGGDIEVQFDSHNKMGEITKTVAVVANTEPAITTLTIKSLVIPQDH